MTRLFSLCMLLLFVSVSCNIKKSNEISVLTLNIRMDNPGDGINAWPNRASNVTDFVEERKPDIFGMQEVMWHQFRYIDSVLSDYGSVYAAREDGIRRGEACPVFYSRERFAALGSGTFWLSSTPEVPGSIGWGAAFPRTVTWVRLFDNHTRDTLVFLNTHFDHISDSARIMSSGILHEHVIKLAGENGFVITGDFNAEPGSMAMQTLRDDGLIQDTYLISASRPEGLKYTFNGWKEGPGGGRIDYIFVRNGMKAKSHNTWKIIKGDVFISDHWPVTATVSQ